MIARTAACAALLTWCATAQAAPKVDVRISESLLNRCLALAGEQRGEAGDRTANGPEVPCPVRGDPGRKCRPSRSGPLTWTVTSARVVLRPGGAFLQAEVEGRFLGATSVVGVETALNLRWDGAGAVELSTQETEVSFAFDVPVLGSQTFRVRLRASAGASLPVGGGEMVLARGTAGPIRVRYAIGGMTFRPDTAVLHVTVEVVTW